MPAPLSDDEVYEALHRALLALGGAAGVTVRGDTALKAARRALTILEMGLLKAMDEGSDQVEGIKPTVVP